MAHNLHYIVLNSESPEDACSTVETDLYGFGTDNNYFKVMGCISEDNEVYKTGDERHFTMEHINIKEINESLIKLVDFNVPYHDTIKEKIKEIDNDFTKLNTVQLYQLERYIKHIYSVKHTQSEMGENSFNVLEHNFRPYEYDEVGVTHFGYDEDMGFKKYVVIIDMHS